MSKNHDLVYAQLADALHRVASPVDAADSHGFISGLICGSGFADPGLWVAEVFEAYDPNDILQAETYTQLAELSQDTLESLNSEEFDFELLLPDESSSLRERTESLGSWCAGFLSGLGLAGSSVASGLSEEGREMLDDMAQIARVDFDLDEPGEEEETAYQEVVEYIRIGVLFLHEELQPPEPSRLQ
jgi:yecA family protein